MSRVLTACAALAVLATTFCSAEAARRDFGNVCYPTHTAVFAEIPGADPHYTHHMAGHRGEKCWYDLHRGTARAAASHREALAARPRVDHVPEVPAPPPIVTPADAPPSPPAPAELVVPAAALAAWQPLPPVSSEHGQWPLVAAASAGLILYTGEDPERAARRAMTARLVKHYASLETKRSGTRWW